MASWSEMNGGARAGLVALGVAGIAVVGTLIWRANQPEAPSTEAVLAASEPAPVTAEPSAAPAAEPADVSAPAIADPIAPSFDSWRVEADGSAVVSGRAEPGALVSVLVDGRSVAETRASGSGAFALLFTLAANDKPSVMMLEAVLADGRQIFSAETIALAAIAGPAPADVAGAETTPPPAAVVVTQDSVTVVQTPAAEEEPAAPEAVEASPEIAATSQESASFPVAAVVVDAISYNEAGDVLLSGKGQAGQFARVYLDNVLTEQTEISASGIWQVTLVDTVPGLYTLRVDQVDGEGKVSARFETPFQRETRERLAALAQGSTPAAAGAEDAAQTGAADAAQSPTAAPVADETSAAEATGANATVTEPSVDQTPQTPTLEAPTPQAPTPQAQEPQVTAPEVAVEQAPAPQEPVAVDETVVAEAAADAAAVVDATEAQSIAPEADSTPEIAPESAASSPPAPQPIQPDVPQPETAATPTEQGAAPAVLAEPTAPDLQSPEAAPPQPLTSAATDTAPSASGSPGTLLQPVTDQAPGTVPATVSITVQPGYTLWGIARASLGNGVLYVQVYNANKDKIKNPDLIYPGQVFTLPVQE